MRSGWSPRLGTTRSRSLPPSPPGRLDLSLVRLQVARGIGSGGVKKVRADLVRVVGKLQILTVGVHAEPPALDLGHVSNQSQERER